MHFYHHFIKKDKFLKNGWMQEMEMYAITWKKEGSGPETEGAACLRIQVTFSEFEMNFTRMK